MAEKGTLLGSMKFGVGDDVGIPGEQGPLLPLRVLVVADLVPRDEHNAGASPPEGALRVDGERFDDLFGKLRPRLAIEVPSVLASGKQVRLDLAPTSLKSFRPDGLCAEVPLLRSLLDGRLVLDRLRNGSITDDQAHGELDRLWSGSPLAREIFGLIAPGGAPAKAASSRSTTPAATPAAKASAASAPAAPAALESILDLVDVGGGAPPPPPAADEPAAPVPVETGRFSDLIASFAKAARSGGGKAVNATEAIGRVEKALGVQVGAILQHPEVRRLERAWRGLRFLVERAQGHTGIRVEVVSTRPADAAKAFQRAVRAGAGAEPPVGFAVVDIEIDGSAASLAQLGAVADIAEGFTVPTLVSGTAGLLGLPDLRSVEGLDHKMGLFSAPERAPWRAAAAKPATRWVTIALNGALARLAYDKTTSRIREAAVKELPADEASHVFLAPAWLVASLVVASFRDTGWPCRLVGPKNGGLVENLPVREVPSSAYEGDAPIAIPTQSFISTDAQREMSKAGVLLLAAAPNSDAVYVLTAPTAYVPPDKRTYDSVTTEPEQRLDRVSLGDQLFVGRLVQFLRTLASRLPASADPAEVQPVVEASVWALFEKAPPAGPELTVTASRKDGVTHVAVTVRPRRFLGVALEEISLELPLG